ncbi:MAG: hypothetical protein AAGP08_10135 [Pseudomonadota bacterium]
MSHTDTPSAIPDRTQKRMNAASPTTKVAGASIAAAIVQILAWLYQNASQEPLPMEVTGALTVIATFVAGYLVPPGSREQVVDAVVPAHARGA